MNIKLRFYASHLLVLLICTIFINFIYSAINMREFSEVLFCLFWLGVSVLYLAYIFGAFNPDMAERTSEEYLAATPSFAKWSKGTIALAIIFLALVYTVYISIGKSKMMYNTSVTYHKQHQRLEESKAGFYDKMWKTYFAKDKIATLNKDVFIEVARVQMENRRDGSQLAWKWVQENSPIPYAEFTAFYKDLSAYIESQRAAYYAIEVECQKIAMYNNILLDTFPNNLLNRVIGREHIESDYGFLSDSTLSVFKNGKENIK